MGYLQSSGSQDGADGVDADVVLAVFSSQTFRGLQVLFLPGQPEFIMTKSDQRESLTHIRNSTFAGVVPYQSWSRPRGANTGDVNDGSAAFLLQELWDDVLYAEEDGLDIDGEDLVEFGFCYIEGWLYFGLFWLAELDFSAAVPFSFDYVTQRLLLSGRKVKHMPCSCSSFLHC